jgi:hypothetical protein
VIRRSSTESKVYYNVQTIYTCDKNIRIYGQAYCKGGHVMLLDKFGIIGR